jgi:hypothetical protein
MKLLDELRDIIRCFFLQKLIASKLLVSNLETCGARIKFINRARELDFLLSSGTDGKSRLIVIYGKRHDRHAK